MFTQITLPYAYDALEPVIDALTVETVKARLAETGRFSAELSHADSEKGLLAFQITDSSSDPEDVWQVFLSVQAVYP